MTRRLVLCALLLVACETRLCRDPNAGVPAKRMPRPPQPNQQNWTPPVYTAQRISTPPTIDGKIDDAVWQKVPWTPAFQRSGAPVPATQKTRAKLAWDDTNLYVAFEVEDDDIVTRDPKDDHPYTRDDDTLYMSEVVEIFLDADGDGKTYNEIEVSPLNKLFDASFLAPREGMDLGWSSGTQHAVVVDGTVNDERDTDKGWTAELAIPFANLKALQHNPPQVGERWRFNLYRLDHGPKGEEGQAFSTLTRPDFHQVQRFGTLVLGGPMP